jgi:phage gp36-like protein
MERINSSLESNFEIDVYKKDNFSLTFDSLLNVLESRTCKICGKSLHFDMQNDSVYVNCDNTQCKLNYFEGFRDLDSGEIVMYYSANGNDASFDENHLSQLNKVLSRR